MPRCQLHVFFCFWFQKRQKINILGIGRDKSQSQYFTVGNTEPEDETEKRHQGPHPLDRAWGGGVRPPWVPPCLASSHIRIPRYQNPKYPINLPRNSP